MSSPKKKYLSSVLLFIVLFVWFYFQYVAYSPLEVRLTPRKTINFDPNKVSISWDSGLGYTSYEIKEIDFSKSESEQGVTVKLPPMKISKIKIATVNNSQRLGGLVNSIEIRGIDDSRAVKQFRRVSEREVTDLPTSKINSLFLVTFQLFLAGFLTLLFQCAFNFFQSVGGIKRFFAGVDEKNLLITCGFLFCIYLLWSLAYWPVAMTNDSWSTLSDVKNLKFGDWHPYFYSFFVLGLLNLYDSLGMLSLFQSLSMSLILGYGFYFCSKQGIRWRYLAPLILFAGLSIPIGTYNTIMWKDVPFSISILLFSILLFKNYLAKYRTNQRVSIRFGEQLLVLLSALGSVFFRHNGIIYTPLFLLIFFVIFDRRISRNISTLFILLFLVIKVVIPKTLDISKPTGAPYQQMRLTLAIMTHPAFYSPTRDEDIAIIEGATKHSWNTIKANYPHRWFWLWDNSEVCKNQWNTNGGQTEEYNTAFLGKLIYYNLPIYLTEQTFGFLHSIGLDYPKSDRNNGFYENPMQTFGSNLSVPGKEFWGLVVHRSPISLKLSSVGESLVTWSTKFNGPISPLFFVWGLTLPFVGILAILFFSKPGEPIVIYLLFHLVSPLFVFFIGAGESWRYFYNIYLCLILLVPFLWISKIQTARGSR